MGLSWEVINVLLVEVFSFIDHQQISQFCAFVFLVQRREEQEGLLAY